MRTLFLTLAAAAGVAAPSIAQSSCGEWTVLSVPVDPDWNRALFEGVAVLPTGEAWAVGYAERPSPPNGPENVTLAMRYADGQWEHTPTPYVAPYPGGADDALHAVAALAPDDVWAAGERYGDAGGLSVGAWIHVLHWNGSAWSEAPTPEPPRGSGINFSGTRVFDVAALAADDVWFSGLWGEPNDQASVTWRPLAMHWDGSDFTVHPTPPLYEYGDYVTMHAMAAVGPDDIWGICTGQPYGGATSLPVLLHWDGSSWTPVLGPSLGDDVLLDDIVATAADDVWVFGHTYWTGTPFALHWDGSSFHVVSSVPSISAATAAEPGQMYLGNDEIHLFDGTTTTLAASFPDVEGPGVTAMDSRHGCLSWAVGRRLESGDLMPFAAVLKELGERYCSTSVNSTGGGAQIHASGSSSAAANDLELSASPVPANQFGLFFYGPSQIELPFGDGFLCVGGGLHRLPVGTASKAMELRFPVDNTLPPATNLTAGSTWNFQAWFRDLAAGGAGYNLSDGVSILFTL